MTETEKSFAFDWQSLPEGFLKWAWISLVHEILYDEVGKKDNMDELSDATDKFTDVRLSIFVGDIEVNAENMMTRLYENYGRAVQHGVKEALADVHMDELTEAVRDAEKAVKKSLVERLKALGVEWEDEYEAWR